MNKLNKFRLLILCSKWLAPSCTSFYTRFPYRENSPSCSSSFSITRMNSSENPKSVRNKIARLTRNKQEKTWVLIAFMQFKLTRMQDSKNDRINNCLNVHLRVMIYKHLLHTYLCNKSSLGVILYHTKLCLVNSYLKIPTIAHWLTSFSLDVFFSDTN